MSGLRWAGLTYPNPLYLLTRNVTCLVAPEHFIVGAKCAGPEQAVQRVPKPQGEQSA